MKSLRIMSLTLAAALVLSAASCGDTQGTTSSAAQSEKPVSSAATASYEKPAVITREGNDEGDYGAICLFDVTSEIAGDQTSLDAYKCEAAALSDTVIAVVYSYAVETMPNYYEPRLDLACYHSVSGSFGEDTQITYRSKFGVKASYLTCDGGLALCEGGKVRLYPAESITEGAHDDGLVEYAGDTLLGLTADEAGVLVPLYKNGKDVYLGANKIDCGLSDVTVGAVGNGGKTVAVSDGKTGVLLDNTGKKLGEADLAALEQRVTPFVTNDSAWFVGKVAGGNSNLTAVRLASDGTATAVEHLFGDFFANTYAAGRIFEKSGSLYLVSALAASTFDFGNATVARLDNDLAVAETIKEIPAGWHTYFRYDATPSGRLLLTENVIDGTDIKDYIHLF